ncbi:MAG TPA: hypothetical protein VHF58_09905 [Solirubrobacterales bacterium]|nr:hypothetical protein [Solirubrobacterales bacterium]
MREFYPEGGVRGKAPRSGEAGASGKDRERERCENNHGHSSRAKLEVARADIFVIHVSSFLSEEHTPARAALKPRLWAAFELLFDCDAVRR